MNSGDQFPIRVGDLQVTVTRKRVKNINFRIAADGTPQMSIPLHVSRAEAERVANEHADWFERALSHTQARAAQVPQEWTTGETLSVWGTATPLRLIDESSSSAPCELKGGELLVCDYEFPVLRAIAVEDWLNDQLVAYVREIMPACEDATGLRPTRVTIRRMKTRWGSCTSSTGRIRLNTALAECPRACTQTVLIHELCHLRVRNHGPQFQALMDLCRPGWRVDQRWLDEHPPSMRTF